MLICLDSLIYGEEHLTLEKSFLNSILDIGNCTKVLARRKPWDELFFTRGVEVQTFSSMIL